MADLISLIVTTWNREDALDAVLRSLATQTDRDFEVIIADDGSGEATAKLIADWASKLGHPLKHVWQEHRGFRAAEIRNRAILASRGTYCIFLDGDCIARPGFVATHRMLAEHGWFVTGNRILMSETLTRTVLRDKLDPEHWNYGEWAARARPRRHQPHRAADAPAARPVAQAALSRLARRALLQSRRSGAAISIASMGSIVPIRAGDAKIPTCWCVSCMPEFAARTACSRPACCICGIRPPTVRGCRITTPSSTRSGPTAASPRCRDCRRWLWLVRRSR